MQLPRILAYTHLLLPHCMCPPIMGSAFAAVAVVLRTNAALEGIQAFGVSALRFTYELWIPMMGLLELLYVGGTRGSSMLGETDSRHYIASRIICLERQP